MTTSIDVIKRFIAEALSEKQSNLLVEPDETNDNNDDESVENKQEQSVCGAVAGVTTPLGTGPTYPRKRKKKNHLIRKK